MQGLVVLLFPAVLMLFALGMDKVQARIDRNITVDAHPEAVLDDDTSADVDSVIRDVLPQAFDELRNRRAGLQDFAADQDNFPAQSSPQRAS